MIEVIRADTKKVTMELHLHGTREASWFLLRFVEVQNIKYYHTLIGLQVTGRIIVDTEAFERFNPQRSENYDELHESDYTVSEVPATNRSKKVKYAEEEASPKIKLTEEAHLICKSTLLGYSLKLKKWRKYFNSH
jgi:hypothetical protein